MRSGHGDETLACLYKKPRAIPHNSKCRYGERGAAAAKPKAQIITGCCKGERRQWRKQRTEAGAAVVECEGLLPRSTMRVPQPDIIEHFGNADAVPQLPERCLSRKAGIVRCCPRFLQGNNAVHFPHPLLCTMVSSLSIHRASTSFSCSIKACPFSTGMQNTPVESASPRPLSLLTMATLFM